MKVALWLKYLLYLIVISYLSSGCTSNKKHINSGKALEYRIIKFSENTESHSNFPNNKPYQLSYFKGLLTLATESLLPDQQLDHQQDEFGNKISPLTVDDGILTSIVSGPNAINGLAITPDGQISSAFDFENDGIVDLVDIVTLNQDRFILANQLGLDFLNEIFNNRNPWCQGMPSLNQLPLFGCDDNSDSSGGGTAGAGFSGQEFADPFAAICAQVDDESPGSQLNGGVYGHGGHGYGRLARVGGYHLIEADIDDHSRDRRRVFSVIIQVLEDSAGNHVRTIRETRYYDDNGDLIKTIQDNVDHMGNGQRTVTDHRPDGSRSTRTSRFTTNVNDDGTYTNSDPLTDPDAPEEHKEYYRNMDPEDREEYDDVPKWPSSITGETPHPGEPALDVAGDWQRWCQATEPGQNPSGIDSVAAEDHGVFDQEICLLSEANLPDGNCINIDSASIFDLEDVLNPPSANHNCGRFEEPGEDGTCGPPSLLGRQVDVSAIRTEGIEICDPSVCRLGFFD